MTPFSVTNPPTPKALMPRKASEAETVEKQADATAVKTPTSTDANTPPPCNG